MLEDKEVKLVKQAKEADHWSQMEFDLQACLQKANDLLLQWDQELEADHQRVERAARDKEKGERVLQEEIERLEDATYVCYEQGFDEALAQVKHLANGNLIDISRVNWERKFVEILAEEAPINRDAQQVVAGSII